MSNHLTVRPDSAASSPDSKYAWYVVAVLVIGYTFSYVDRTILTLMVGPIQKSLKIGDVQVSLLHGLAFAAFYTMLGVPIARFVDRGKRTAIISICVFVWSIMTALCGFARTFAMMFLARVGVGVGEAGFSPAAYSIITDYFPADKLSRALSVYTAALYLGSGLALLLGGAAIAAVPAINMPGFGEMEPWRVVFLLVGLPGLVTILLMTTVREPVRRGTAKGAQSGKGYPFKDVVRYFLDRKGAYLLMIFGLSFHSLMWNGASGWIPTYFIRTFQWTAPEAGFWFGLAMLIFGIAGVLAGGITSAWLRGKGHIDSNLRVGIISCFAVLPFGALIPFMADPWSALACMSAFVFFSSYPYGCAAAAFQEITPNQMRGQITAIYFFVLNLAGIGIGPTVVATFTEVVFKDPAAVKYSMACTIGLASPIAALLLWQSLRYYRAVIAAMPK